MEKVICKDHICEYGMECCCKVCEKLNECDEVCDGMDAAGLEEPCPWRSEVKE